MDTSELPLELRRDIERLETVADKIRLLNSKGLARADIARVLDKRYQHVRNVLERDNSVARQAETAEIPGPDEVLRFQVGADGTLRLPPGVLKGLEIERGGVLSGRLENGQLRLVEPLVALRRVQEALKPLADRLHAEGRSVVDEFIAERREEARREAEE